MQLTFALLAVLCLSVPVLSLDALCKNITGVKNFNFSEFITHKYYYVLGTNTPDIESFASASETAVPIGDKYVSTFTVTTYDGYHLSTNTLIDSINGATLTEIVLYRGALTKQSYTITFYAFKNKKYAQLYVCGSALTETDKDLRFAIVFGKNSLSPSLRQELTSNDAQFGFKGDLIRIGGELKQDDDE